jgi:hypothetical protein
VRLTSLLVVSALGSLLGCYEQPVIPPDKPLSCNNADADGECPAGFACIGNRVCAPMSCGTDASPCPAGLICTNRGCILPTTDAAVPPFTAPGFVMDAAIEVRGPDLSIVLPNDALVAPLDAGLPDAPQGVDGGGGN